MSFFTKVINFISGGIGEKIIETVREYFPPALSEADRVKIEVAIREASRQHELRLIALAQREQQAFDQRVKELEGTAADLRQFGFIGKIVIFLRGIQRPIWGFFVLYLDLMVFSGRWEFRGVESGGASGALPLDLLSAFWVVNFLVLGFLFGERAMRNVMPFFKQRMGVNSSNGDHAKG
jgi:hypothetical protein